MPADLSAIRARLNGITAYHPYEADTFADWTVEAGDYVTVSRDATNYKSPLSRVTHKWNGTHRATVNATGNEERPSIKAQSFKKYASGGYGMSGNQDLYWTIWSEDGWLNSTMFATASVIGAEMADLYNGLFSYLELTASHLLVQFWGMYDGLSSELELTRSRLSLEFHGLYDGLHSELEVTRSNLRAEFIGLYDGLHGELELTRSQLRVEFQGMYDGLSSELELTRSRLRLEFNGMYDGIRSELELTRSRLRVEFQGLYDGLSSNLELTRSRLRVEFYGLYDGLNSSLELTRSRLRIEFQGLYDGLNSNLELTRSRLRVEFYGLYDGLNSNLELTRSRLRVEFYGLYDGLNSSFELTRSRLMVEFYGLYDGLNSSFELTRSRLMVQFEGLYDGLSSSLEVTRSQLRAEFNGMYDGLHGELVVTRSQLSAEFSGMYDGLRGELTVTRSQLTTAFSDYYNQMNSRLIVTASELTTQFNNYYSQLSSTFTVTASQMATTFNDYYNSLNSSFVVTASTLAARLNDYYSGLSNSLTVTASSLNSTISNNYTGLKSYINQTVSNITLSAEKIYMYGNTTLAGLLTISGGDLDVSKNIRTSLGGNNYVQTNKLTLVGSGGSQGAQSTTLSESDISDMIIKAAVDTSTNTLKLWKKGDSTSGTPSITFSKATSVSDLTGDWSGSTLTVTTNPLITGVQYTVGFGGNYGAHSTELELTSNGSLTKQTIFSTQYVNAPIKVCRLTGMSSEPAEVFTDVISFDPANLLQVKTGSAKITSNGTYTPGTNYIGFASVEVDVPTSTTVTDLDGNWSGSTLTITTDPVISGIQYTIGFGGNYGSHNTEFELTSNGSLSKTTVMGTQYVNAPIKVCYLTGQSSPVSVFTDTISFDPSGLLQDKTGTAKITANGTYTPGTNYIGFSSVEVDVSSSGGSWNDGWDAARGYLAYPDTISSGVEQTTFYMKVPNAARTGQDTTSYKFVINEGTPAASGYVSVSDGSGHVYGRVSVGDWYTSGWEASYGEVKLNYNSNQTIQPGNSITIYPVAKATPTGQPVIITSKGITVTASSGGAGDYTGLTVNSSGNTIVASSSSTDTSVTVSVYGGSWSGTGASKYRTFYVRANDTTNMTGTALNVTDYGVGYEDGFEAAYDEVKLNYTTSQSISPGGSITVYPVAKATSTGEPIIITSKGVTITATAATISIGSPSTSSSVPSGYTNWTTLSPSDQTTYYKFTVTAGNSTANYYAKVDASAVYDAGSAYGWSVAWESAWNIGREYGWNAGLVDGRNSVNIVKGSWQPDSNGSGSQISFSKSLGSSDTKRVYITGGTQSREGAVYKIPILDKTVSSAPINTGCYVTIDTSATYNPTESEMTIYNLGYYGPSKPTSGGWYDLPETIGSTLTVTNQSGWYYLVPQARGTQKWYIFKILANTGSATTDYNSGVNAQASATSVLFKTSGSSYYVEAHSSLGGNERQLATKTYFLGFSKTTYDRDTKIQLKHTVNGVATQWQQTPELILTAYWDAAQNNAVLTGTPVSGTQACTYNVSVRNTVKLSESFQLQKTTSAVNLLCQGGVVASVPIESGGGGNVTGVSLGSQITGTQYNCTVTVDGVQKASTIDAGVAVNTGKALGWYEYYDSSFWQKPSASNGWECKCPKRDYQGGSYVWFNVADLGYSSGHSGSPNVTTGSSWYVTGVGESNAKPAAAQAMSCKESDLDVRKIGSGNRWVWFKTKCSGGGSTKYVLIGF